MPINHSYQSTFTGYKKAEKEAIEVSNTSTYRDKYIHIEWIEDNHYQINVTDICLIDTNSDIASCWKNGVRILSQEEIDQLWADSGLPELHDDFDGEGDNFNNEDHNPKWSDDDAQY